MSLLTCCLNGKAFPEGRNVVTATTLQPEGEKDGKALRLCGFRREALAQAGHDLVIPSPARKLMPTKQLFNGAILKGPFSAASTKKSEEYYVSFTTRRDLAVRAFGNPEFRTLFVTKNPIKSTTSRNAADKSMKQQSTD